ncbi:PREDICTED: cylicin-1-like isoform X1 [Eufriesea mexicana]|uniref:cylicin-1-like isoform X1 n=1 Tax=Eufriesea mexicana TaxID=516756 RepID=UPI00083C45BD|nr:PREDICTED: cylicin-1-like isoform X1 [Eufriesea mexicana]XP_017754280.1 PREDICTED: cylicin-1-like isoform X2 [Eufriesea mexicana]XP_017754281.1 PREDICTED: cylicin-1-like isoform X1 [Eufriesea mexicana]
MAPRKTAKHSDTEVVDRAAEAGNILPPKRKKAVAKTVNKSDEEKQIRLPRAAKLTKTEQSETADLTSVITENAKTKTKTSLLGKNVSELAKSNSKVKITAKKNKGAAEKTDTSSVNLENVENPEKTEMKKTRTKPATKKAGIDVDDESKIKSKGKTKKGIASEGTENLEVPVTKRKKQANTEAISKESKAKAVKKEIDTNTDIKDKNANKGTKKAKISSSNEIKNNVKTEESIATIKANKKSNDDKSSKVTVARKTRGRKNEPNSEDISKDDKDSKTEELSSSEPEHTNSNESQDVQNNQPETAETTQTSKKGRNVKKKEVPQKKATKMRGKTVNRNADIASNENDAVKETQKKINKDSVPTTKRGRGKKGIIITTGKDENTENTSENAPIEEKKVLHLSETLTSSNNVQKSSDEDNDKKQDLKKEETKNTKTLGTLKKTDEANMIKIEINENNVINTSIHEDEN